MQRIKKQYAVSISRTVDWKISITNQRSTSKFNNSQFEHRPLLGKKKKKGGKFYTKPLEWMAKKNAKRKKTNYKEL